MWPNEWKAGTSDVTRELEKWAGGSAQAWGYSVSHSQLLIRLFRDSGNKENRTSLYLYLKDCRQVSFRDSWHEVAIEIAEQPGELGFEYTLTDGERFYARCGVKPFAAESEEFLSIPSPALGADPQIGTGGEEPDTHMP